MYKETNRHTHTDLPKEMVWWQMRERKSGKKRDVYHATCHMYIYLANEKRWSEQASESEKKEQKL